MNMQIGIPRALLTYHFLDLWETYFRQMNFDVLVSSHTNRKIMDMGIKACVDDACLPVKVFHGHVCYLRNKVDYIFLPRIISMEKNEFICPKFCGLPEMIRFKTPIQSHYLVFDLNLYKNPHELCKQYVELGMQLGQTSKIARQALMVALKQWKPTIFYTKLINDSYKNIAKNPTIMRSYPITNKNDLLIGILGHPYVVYDEFINMNMIQKLDNYGASVITPEMLSSTEIENENEDLPKKMFWTYGKILYGAAKCYLSRKIDGIIYISSFGCGIDSILYDIIERRIRKNSKIPFLFISLDEHSGEAGLNTRIEAFIDMIYWRRQNGPNISSYGEYLHSR